LRRSRGPAPYEPNEGDVPVRRDVVLASADGGRCPGPAGINGGDPEARGPQIMTMEAKFVRAAYNNEGYVILGYQVNNRSIGEEWMLIEVGITARDNTPGYKL